MSTTEEIITGLQRQRADATTTAAGRAACDQQIAAHRQIAALRHERVGYVARGKADRVKAVDEQITFYERLVDTKPDPLPAASAADAPAAAATPRERQQRR